MAELYWRSIGGDVDHGGVMPCTGVTGGQYSEPPCPGELDALRHGRMLHVNVNGEYAAAAMKTAALQWNEAAGSWDARFSVEVQ